MQRIRKVIVFTLFMLASATARGETTAEREAAQKAFQRGDAAFKANDFQAALAAFNDGYALSQRPRFLLNIAHTQRKLGLNREALANYRKFLNTDPKPEDQQLAQQMIQEVEPLVAQAEAASPASPPPVQPIPPAFVAAPPPMVIDAPAPTAQPESSPLYKRWYVWAGVGAVIAAGVLVGVALSSGGDSAERTGSWGDLRL